MRAGRPRPRLMQPPATLRCPRIEPCFLEVVYGPIESQPTFRAARFARCGNPACGLDLLSAGCRGLGSSLDWSLACKLRPFQLARFCVFGPSAAVLSPASGGSAWSRFVPESEADHSARRS